MQPGQEHSVDVLYQGMTNNGQFKLVSRTVYGGGDISNSFIYFTTLQDVLNYLYQRYTDRYQQNGTNDLYEFYAHEPGMSFSGGDGGEDYKLYGFTAEEIQMLEQQLVPIFNRDQDE